MIKTVQLFFLRKNRLKLLVRSLLHIRSHRSFTESGVKNKISPQIAPNPGRYYEEKRTSVRELLLPGHHEIAASKVCGAS